MSIPPQGAAVNAGYGGANERLQRLFIDLVALVEIDGGPGLAFLVITGLVVLCRPDWLPGAIGAQ